jgi:hypothetical protein
MYGSFKAMCKSRTGVRLGKFSVVQKNFILQALQFQ